VIPHAYASLKKFTFGMPFTVLLGFALGGLMAPLGVSLLNEAYLIYDNLYPVIKTEGKLLSVGAGEAVIAIVGEKLRPCTYVRIQAYAVGRDGNLEDAFIARIDAPESGETRPVGSYTLGAWRVWPLPNSKGIVVYANHLCGSRLVLTKIADIPLSEPAPKGKRS
jgi:hypothetical protein